MIARRPPPWNVSIPSFDPKCDRFSAGSAVMDRVSQAEYPCDLRNVLPNPVESAEGSIDTESPDETVQVYRAIQTSGNACMFSEFSILQFAMRPFRSLHEYFGGSGP